MHLGENTVQPLVGIGRELTGFIEERHILLLLSECFLPQKFDAALLIMWAGADGSAETKSSGELPAPSTKSLSTNKDWVKATNIFACLNSDPWKSRVTPFKPAVDPGLHCCN